VAQDAILQLEVVNRMMLSLQWELKRLLRAVIVLSSHFFIAMVAMLSLWVLEMLSRRLLQSSNSRPFGGELLEPIFGAVEVAVVVMFIFNGILEVFQSYRRRPFRDRFKRDQA
jgi:uncharacterized membrane protein